MISSCEPPEKSPRPSLDRLTTERSRVHLANLTELITDAREAGLDDVSHLALRTATLLRQHLNDTRPDNAPPSAPVTTPNTGT